MLRRLSVTRSRFAADQDAILAEAVMNTQTATDPLTVDERIVYDADEYLGSIMMDGHILTLSNKGLERINEMDLALQQIGANRERALLGDAVSHWKERGYCDFAEADDALLGAFEVLDERFFEAASTDNSLEFRIKAYVREHLDTFIILE
jgi:hypothetical protein